MGILNFNSSYADFINAGWKRLADGTLKRPAYRNAQGNYQTDFVKFDKNGGLSQWINRVVDDTNYHRATTTILDTTSGREISRAYGQKGNYVSLSKSYPRELPSNREIFVNNKTGQVTSIEINNPHNHILYDYNNNLYWTRGNWESYHTNGSNAGIAPISAADAIKRMHLL